jgi:hypothetical protein
MIAMFLLPGAVSAQEVDTVGWHVLAQDERAHPCLATYLKVIFYGDNSGSDPRSPFYPSIQTHAAIIAGDQAAALSNFKEGKSREAAKVKFGNWDAIVKDLKSDAITYNCAIGCQDRYALSYLVKTPTMEFPFVEASDKVGDRYFTAKGVPMTEFFMEMMGAFSVQMLQKPTSQEDARFLSTDHPFCARVEVNEGDDDRLVPVATADIQPKHAYLWMNLVPVPGKPTIGTLLQSSAAPAALKAELAGIEDSNAKVDADGRVWLATRSDAVHMSKDTTVLRYLPSCPPAVFVSDGRMFGVRIAAIDATVKERDIRRLRDVLDRDVVLDLIQDQLK